jgi:ATP sulfurylase
MRLPSGLAWSVPVTLAVQPDELEQIGSATEVELVPTENVVTVFPTDAISPEK